MTTGNKDDKQKPPIFRGVLAQFPNAIEMIAQVSEFGANKYSWENWHSVDNAVERYTDALARHLVREAKGEVVDHESGFLSAAHTAWNALTRLELMLRNDKQLNKMELDL